MSHCVLDTVRMEDQTCNKASICDTFLCGGFSVNCMELHERKTIIRVFDCFQLLLLPPSLVASAGSVADQQNHFLTSSVFVG